VAQLGHNADGEVLVSGRVPDCYMGLRLEPEDDQAGGVLVVAPAALLHRSCRSRTASCCPSW
jgi:hypothetical protein